jgi:hypothetical protein
MKTLGADNGPVVLLAGCAAQRAALRERARRVLADADHEALAYELARRRLLPLVGTRALEAAGDLCPPSFHAHVRAAVTAARARGISVEADLRHATRLLADRGIHALPLKGPVLAADAHGDFGLRETDDVDLLVAPSALHEAADALTAAGYARAGDPIRPNGLPDLHIALNHPDRPTIDLHWRVHWYEEAFSADMLARAEPGPDGLLRARPDDLAAALLLFYARDGLYGVRLAADIAGWWDRHGHALPPHFLEGHARGYPALAPSLTAAAAATERLTGAPASDWLGSAAVHGRRVELATRLSDWTQTGDRDQLAANISLADGLLGPRGSTGDFARRQLRPRAGALTPHAAKTIARYGIALWRVRGGRWWAPLPDRG